MIKIFGLQRQRVNGEGRKVCSGSAIRYNLLKLLRFKPKATRCVRQITPTCYLSDITRLHQMYEVFRFFFAGDSEECCIL
jgi:hypothetical protein